MSSSMLERFVNKFKAEGVDHIRIHPFADTHLGKILSKDWRHKFFVPHVGEFTSPTCFANWICTGNDDARHNTQFRVNTTVKGYLSFVLYAKYYQLCSMRNMLAREMQNLPFVAYKTHQSGVKEFDRWKEYPSEIRDMIDHILDENRGPKVPYNWEERHPGLVQRIQDLIKEMVGEPDEASVQPQRKNGKKRFVKEESQQDANAASDEAVSAESTEQLSDQTEQAEQA